MAIIELCKSHHSFSQYLFSLVNRFVTLTSLHTETANPMRKVNLARAPVSTRTSSSAIIIFTDCITRRQSDYCNKTRYQSLPERRRLLSLLLSLARPSPSVTRPTHTLVAIVGASQTVLINVSKSFSSFQRSSVLLSSELICQQMLPYRLA